MKSFIIRTEAQVQELTLKEITSLSNVFARELGLKETKRFSTKPLAVKKYMANQTEYQSKLPVVEEPTVKTSTPTVKKSEFLNKIIDSTVDHSEITFGTIERSILQAIIASWDVNSKKSTSTVQDIITYVIEFHKRPRSTQSVDQAYVIHNIKWFLNKGSLIIVE